MRPPKRILLVEEDAVQLSLLRFLIHTRGNYRVITAASSIEALNILDGVLDSPGPGFNLLIADLALRQIDGVELIRRAKLAFPHTPALLTSRELETYQPRMMAAADSFLPLNICTAFDVLNRIRILCTCKRGPKKQIAAEPEFLKVAA